MGPAFILRGPDDRLDDGGKREGALTNNLQVCGLTTRVDGIAIS